MKNLLYFIGIVLFFILYIKIENVYFQGIITGFILSVIIYAIYTSIKNVEK